MENRVSMEAGGIRINIGSGDNGIWRSNIGGRHNGSGNLENIARAERDVRHVCQVIGGSRSGVIRGAIVGSRFISDDSKRQGIKRLDDRHHQRTRASSPGRTNRYALGLYRHPVIRGFQLVCHSISQIGKKAIIPAAVVTTAFFSFHVEKAEASLFNGSWLPTKEQPFKVTNPFKGVIDLSETVMKWIDYFQNLKLIEVLHKATLDVMIWVYKMLNDFVLHTPVWLFQHAAIQEMVQTFSFLSVGVVIMAAIYEGIKRMFSAGKKTSKLTTLEDLSYKLPLAILGAGCAPTLFIKGFTVLNWISASIGNMGASTMKVTADTSELSLIWLDVLGLLLFDVAMIAYLIPILLQNGRRFFDLLCLNILTPFALSAWAFNRHRNLHSQWWNAVKSLSLVQVIHSLFICLLGVLIFATPNTLTGGALIFKIVMIIGGLWRMSNPPRILSQYNSDFGSDLGAVLKGAMKSLDVRSVAKRAVSGKIISKFTGVGGKVLNIFKK